MGNHDNLYSRFVALSKVLLPLAALALLSTLFLFARGRTGEGDIPYAELEAIAREPRLSQPNFSGVAEDGSVFDLSATSARPDLSRPGFVTVEMLALAVQSPDGSTVNVTAGQGEVDTDAKTARISGLARLTTSSGYEMETQGIIADLTTGRVETVGPLEARAPFGQITAGQLIVEPATADTGTRMVFKNGVRLLYQPQN